MMLKLVIGGMKLQPCNPTFLNARDAILAADQAFYDGVNQCLIWKGFAKRGMGIDAVNDGYLDGFKVPDSCQ
jgi:extracellular elastinolytic metalloproteinase